MSKEIIVFGNIKIKKRKFHGKKKNFVNSLFVTNMMIKKLNHHA